MTANLEDKKAYESMDKTAFLDEYFFKGDKYTKEGQEFVDKINAYNAGVKAALGTDAAKFSGVLDKRFSTSEKTNKDGKKIAWLDYHYKGFPMVASLTNFTQIQADVKKYRKRYCNLSFRRKNG